MYGKCHVIQLSQPPYTLSTGITLLCIPHHPTSFYHCTTLHCPTSSSLPLPSPPYLYTPPHHFIISTAITTLPPYTFLTTILLSLILPLSTTIILSLSSYLSLPLNSSTPPALPHYPTYSTTLPLFTALPLSNTLSLPSTITLPTSITYILDIILDIILLSATQSFSTTTYSQLY